MHSDANRRRRALPLGAAAAGVLAFAAAAGAQTWTVSGDATALQATVAGIPAPQTTVLAATGALADDGDARQASLAAGSLPALGGASALHATTISALTDGRVGDEVASESSVADLTLAVGGATISAALVRAAADAPAGGAAVGSAAIDALTVNGLAVLPSGTENETIALPGLTLVLNQVLRTADSIRVNGLRITSGDGLVDVVVASASAGLGR